MTKSIYTTEHDKLRQLLIEHRKRAGATQSEMAKCLHRPQSFVSKYERGERRLDVLEFLEVAYCLNLDGPSLLAELVRNTKFDVARIRPIPSEVLSNGIAIARTGHREASPIRCESGAEGKLRRTPK